MKYVIAFLITLTLAAIGFMVYRSYGPEQTAAAVQSESCKDLSVVMFMSPYCKYCKMAKEILDKYGVDYRPIDVQADADKRQTMVKITGLTSVPQIYMEGVHIGGYSELNELEQSGKLAKFLKTCNPSILGYQTK